MTISILVVVAMLLKLPNQKQFVQIEIKPKQTMTTNKKFHASEQRDNIHAWKTGLNLQYWVFANFFFGYIIS